jgi:uncharacterized protein YaiL (DUF2058 family)
MSLSLREQLIKAGLATEKQANQVSHEHRQRGRHQPRPESIAQEKLAAQQAQAAKASRDQELNRQQQIKAEKKARIAAIRQLIEQNRLPKIESEDRFNFVDEGVIHAISVDAALRERLNRGEVMIARYGRHYEVVPAETAARIRERDERFVITLDLAPPGTDENDPYKDFVVPDDLTW